LPNHGIADETHTDRGEDAIFRGALKFWPNLRPINISSKSADEFSDLDSAYRKMPASRCTCSRSGVTPRGACSDPSIDAAYRRSFLPFAFRWSVSVCTSAIV